MEEITLNYKGYYAKVNWSEEDQVYYGKILFTKDFVNFHTPDLNEIVKEFRSAVDDYIEFKKLIGKE